VSRAWKRRLSIGSIVGLLTIAGVVWAVARYFSGQEADAKIADHRIVALEGDIDAIEADVKDVKAKQENQNDVIHAIDKVVTKIENDVSWLRKQFEGDE